MLYNTKTQGKVNELAELFASSIKIESERLYRSGLIDHEKFDQGQYALAKILVTAAIHRLKDDFSPLHDRQLQREIKNLLHA